MKPIAYVAAAVLLLSTLASTMAGEQVTAQATAELRNAQGEPIGTATLVEGHAGVIIKLQVSKLPPGPHGLHIHAVGRCDPPDFLSAGTHFNPLGKQHGQRNPEGTHAGDLPNLLVGADGTAHVEVPAALVTLAEGPHSLFPAAGPAGTSGGTALVIHEAPDDDMTDPDGKTGTRIACGVITK
jgi:superoxide dismutase, Cu-Zn family